MYCLMLSRYDFMTDMCLPTQQHDRWIKIVLIYVNSIHALIKHINMNLYKEQAVLEVLDVPYQAYKHESL